MKPITRKQLEDVLVTAWDAWMANRDDTRVASQMSVDAIWGAMVPARKYYGDGEMFAVGDARDDQGFRALICTNEPPAGEPDGLRLARMVRKAWPRPRSPRFSYVDDLDAIITEAGRIIEEAGDE